VVHIMFSHEFGRRKKHDPKVDVESDRGDELEDERSKGEDE
jgi:hypothetical protein